MDLRWIASHKRIKAGDGEVMSLSIASLSIQPQNNESVTLILSGA